MNSWMSTSVSACDAAVDDVHHRDGQHVRVRAADVAEQRQARRSRRPPWRRRARRRGSRWRRGAPCWGCRRGRSAPGRRGAARWRRSRGSRGRSRPRPRRRPSRRPCRRSGSSPSRSSTASKAPVEAPEGTAARATVPSSRRDLDLDGRVAAGVEDLAGDDGVDAGHGALRTWSGDCFWPVEPIRPARDVAAPPCARAVREALWIPDDHVTAFRSRSGPCSGRAPQRPGHPGGAGDDGVARPEHSGSRTVRPREPVVASAPRPGRRARRHPRAVPPVAAPRGDARVLRRHRHARRPVGAPRAHGRRTSTRSRTAPRPRRRPPLPGCARCTPRCASTGPTGCCGCTRALSTRGWPATGARARP